MSVSTDQLFEAARRIPRGRVVSYGALGSVLLPPVSGRMVGRMMSRCPPGIPWWRVLARTGRMPISKISPSYADEQAAHLVSEGVKAADGQVDMARYALTDAELALLE